MKKICVPLEVVLLISIRSYICKKEKKKWKKKVLNSFSRSSDGNYLPEICSNPIKKKHVSLYYILFGQSQNGFV